MIKKPYAIGVIVLGMLGLVFSMQNCSKVAIQATPGFLKALDCDPLSTASAEQMADCVVLPEKQALVYGAEADDRDFLAKKLLGYPPPGLSEIFSKWRRVSSGTVYPNAAAVNVGLDEEKALNPAFADCLTGLDANGNWNKTTVNGAAFDPSKQGICANSVAFASASWTVLSTPNRLRNSTNSGSFNGFVSSVPLDRYVHEATLTSTDRDDDMIGLIIAFTVDPKGDVHTLSAIRTQGGGSPNLGWGLLYKMNNDIKKTLGNRSVGGINKNGTDGNGDKLGWNSRKTRIKIERDGNKIAVSASTWFTTGSAPAFDPASRIEIDLADKANGLEIFQGAQSYGYAIQSQAGAEFHDIKFNTMVDAEYVYDLVNDFVYRRNDTGGYTLQPGLKAFEHLGYPVIVGNIETMKQFILRRDYTFEILP
jgi:hypothetical protein